MRVLILSAKTGGGHMRAAQALEEVIKNQDPGNEVLTIDGLEYVNHYFNKAVVEGYKFSAMKLPKMYGILYHASNNDSGTYKLVQRTNSHFAKKFIPLLTEFRPDVIVSTHPFMSIMCSRLREKGVTNIPLISIITDFAPHAAYINPCVSEYIVSSAQMVDALEELGVDRNIVHPVGIPIPPIFFESDSEKDAHLAEMGFDPSKKTVLVMAGSFGVTDILKIYESLNDVKLDFQIIVITGRNQKLFNAFNTIINGTPSMRVGDIQVNFEVHDEVLRRDAKIRLTKPTKLIYFTDEVHKYMHIADLIITKPGGLTVTESLASCLPMVLFRGIPGQETDNTEYLTANNLAVSIQKESTEDKLRNMIMEKKRSNVEETIYNLLKYPEKLRSMRESCSRLNNKDSAYNVYEIMKKSVESMTEKKHFPTPEDLESMMTDDAEAERLIREFEEVIKKYSGEDDTFTMPDDSDGEYDFEDKGYKFLDMMYQNFKKIRAEHKKS